VNNFPFSFFIFRMPLPQHNYHYGAIW